MITLQRVKGEIVSIESMTKQVWDMLKKSQVKAKKKRLAFLRLIFSYLKHEPKEDYIQKEVNRLGHRIYLLDKLYIEIPDKPKDEREFMKNYKKENNYKGIKEQIKALKFILKGD